MIENVNIFYCRHTLGIINGECMDCGERASISQKHYSIELRRILGGGIIMEKGIINFEELEKHIKQIESIMKNDGLTQIEQDLVLKQTYNRLQKKMEEQKAQDMVMNMPGMSFVQKMIGKQEQDEP